LTMRWIFSNQQRLHVCNRLLGGPKWIVLREPFDEG